MQMKLWIGAACLWGVAACGHASPVASTSARPSALATALPMHGANARTQDSSLHAQSQRHYLDAYSVGERPQDADRPRVALVAPTLDEGASGHAGEGANLGGSPIERFVLSRGIQDQKPVDEARTFKPGERVYAFVEIANPTGVKFALNLRWAHDNLDLGQPTAVNIGASKRWRAWSSHRAPEQTGSYRCVVETHDGQPVAEIPFRVEI